MLKKKPLILAIETSCDETAAAVTWGRQILSNIIWSQIAIHRPWGGVVPNLARRAHQKHINSVIASALKTAKKNRKRLGIKKPINLKTIDAVAVTQGPGLAIALEVGIKKAKEIAKKYKKPLISVDHMEGHLLSSMARNFKLKFPALGLLVSGGHTQLVLIKKIGCYQVLGQTLDDAAGEAFDKVAKMLGLPYPGGPEIARLAQEGNSQRFNFPIPMIRNQTLNFSFSGLKTACLYKLKEFPQEKRDQQFLKDFAASFQFALVRAIIVKLQKAIEKYQPQQLMLGGGVINNAFLRKEIKTIAHKQRVEILLPQENDLLSDNAAMIGIAAYFKFLKKDFVKNIDRLDRKPNLSLKE